MLLPFRHAIYITSGNKLIQSYMSYVIMSHKLLSVISSFPVLFLLLRFQYFLAHEQRHRALLLRRMSISIFFFSRMSMSVLLPVACSCYSPHFHSHKHRRQTDISRQRSARAPYTCPAPTTPTTHLSMPLLFAVPPSSPPAMSTCMSKLIAPVAFSYSYMYLISSSWFAVFQPCRTSISSEPVHSMYIIR